MNEELVSPLSFDSHPQDISLDLGWPSAVFWERKTGMNFPGAEEMLSIVQQVL